MSGQKPNRNLALAVILFCRGRESVQEKTKEDWFYGIKKIVGAGLGLSIAKEILDLHRAEVCAVSRKEGGTMAEVRFKVYEKDLLPPWG